MKVSNFQPWPWSEIFADAIPGSARFCSKATTVTDPTWCKDEAVREDSETIRQNPGLCRDNFKLYGIRAPNET
jgi:hypothetical protein